MHFTFLSRKAPPLVSRPCLPCQSRGPISQGGIGVPGEFPTTNTGVDLGLPISTAAPEETVPDWIFTPATALHGMASNGDGLPIRLAALLRIILQNAPMMQRWVPSPAPTWAGPRFPLRRCI